MVLIRTGRLAVAVLALIAVAGPPVSGQQIRQEDRAWLEAFTRGEATTRPGPVAPPGRAQPSRPPHRLATLADDLVAQLRDRARAGATPDPAEALRGLARLDAEARRYFAGVRQRLEAAHAGPSIFERLDRAEERAGERLATLAATLDDVARLSNGADRRAAVAAALAEMPSSVSPTIHGALPYRSLSLAPRPPARTPEVVPSYLNPLAAPATSLDLQETPEAPLAPAIAAQAAALGHDYARIYDFVRNDIRTEWYGGSQKGAEGTLLAGTGNDVDKASLLVALYRASQLPARYVRGVVRVPVATIAANLGLSDDQRVPGALARAGVAHDVVLVGGGVRAVDVQHTWVTAYPPYANYRGAVVDFSGLTWVPLAPAIQGTDWAPPTAVLEQMGFDTDGFIDNYLAGAQPTTPLAALRQQVEAYLEPSGEAYADQLGSRQVAARRLELLPGTMPSPVVVATYEGPELPVEERLEVRLTMWPGGDAQGTPSLDATLPLASLSGRRWTLSYTPATADDDAVVNLYGGLDAVPPYLVHLLPTIKLGGRTVAVGTASIPMATRHAMRVEITAPGATLRRDFQPLAVAYGALALEAPGGAAHPDPGEDPADTEALAARLLNQLAQRYAAAWSQGEAELAGLLDVALVRPLPALALALNRLRVDSLFDVPLALSWEGVDLDAAMRVAEPLANRESADRDDWFTLAALTGSAEERAVFEREFLAPAISADRGLGLARDDGLAVLTATAATVDDLLAAVELPAYVEQAIRDQALAGWTVELAEAEVSDDAWRGAVWRAEDPDAPASGYFLAGGLAGGATTQLPENWVLTFLAQALAAPYSPDPNDDPLAGVEISKLLDGDNQTGIVGEIFARLLQVRVRDASGRPVEGASVEFTSERGAGVFVDGDGGEHPSTFFATTSSQGIASALLRAGTDVAANPTYVYRNPDDPLPTAVLSHEIGARVDGTAGSISLELPFRALAFPGEALGLLRTDTAETNFVRRVGFLGDLVPVQAVDALGNAISNVELLFEVGAPSPPDPACSNRAPAPLNAALIDADDWSNCPPSLPAVGYCGQSALLRTTGPSPATAGVILGSGISSAYTVFVSAPAAPELGLLTFNYSSPYSVAVPSGRCSPGAPLVEDLSSHVVFSRELVDGEGNPVQATLAGIEYAQPIEIRMASWNADWGTICTLDANQQCGPPYFEGELDSGVWVPARGNIELSLDTAGSLSPALNLADGLLQTTLQTDLDPQLNTISFYATELFSTHHQACPACTIDCPHPDPEVDCTSDCAGAPGPPECAACPLCTLDCPGEGCDLDCPIDLPFPPSCLDSGRGDILEIDWAFQGVPFLLDTHVNSVWGVAPSIEAFEPDPAPLSDDGALTAETRIDYITEPQDYVALSADLEIYVNDEWASSGAGSSLGGAGSGRIQRGYELSLDDDNEVELVLNRGTAAEVRSPRVPIPLGQRILTETEGAVTNDLVGRRQLRVSQDVDLVNQRVCSIPDLFYFTLTQASAVTLTFEKIASVDPDGTPSFDPPIAFLVDESLEAGEHSYSVTAGAGAGDLTLGPGDYRFSLRATADTTGLVEEISGTARSTLRVTDHLPVGHALVEGVDLFDGHLTLSREDFDIPGRGPALELRRTYSSSADRELRGLGVGWTHNYDSHLVVTPCGEVILIGGEGSGMRFVDDGAGGLEPLKGYHGSLIADPSDNSFDFYSRSGRRFHYAFDPRATHWLLDFIEDPNGNRTTLVYDPNAAEARVSAVMDPAGRRLDFFYDNRTFVLAGEVALTTQRVLVAVEGPEGVGMSFDYDDHGHLIRAAREEDARVEQYAYNWVIDPLLPPRQALVATVNALDGATTQYQYQGGLIGVTAGIEAPRLLTTQVTRPEGGVTQFVYDTGGLQTRAGPELEHEVVDPRGFTTTYRLNQYGSPVAVTDPLGNTTLTTWTPDDVLVTSRTDANGHTTSFTYDAHANLLSEEITVVDANGTSQVYRRENTYLPPTAFDPSYIKDRAATRTDRNGHTTSFQYDARGNLTRSEIEVGATTLATLLSYLANGDRASTTDPRGGVTQFTYDAYGNLASVRDPLGQLSETTWNARSHPVSTIDPLGRETSFTYDSLGRLLSKTMPLDAVETMVHDDIANTRTTTDAEGRVTVQRFDREGRPVETQNAAGGSRLMAYDAAGNKTLETTWHDEATPRHDTTFAYDDAGRLSRRSEPLGHTTDYTYDGVGNVLSETLSDATDPGFAPRVRETDYDALDRPIRRRRFLGTTPVETTLLLDGEGNLLTETDPLGRVTTHAYDALDRRVETLEPEWQPGQLKRTIFDYDANGNLLTETRFNQPFDQVRSRTYDALDRLVTETSTTGGTTSFEYDAVGNLTRETDPNGNVVSHVYDALDRRERTIQTLDGADAVTRFTYDRVGNRLSEEWPNGNLVSHGYDALNRLVTSSDLLGPLTSATYDARGNRLTETDANGNLTTNTWDALDRLVTQDLSADRTLGFAYDVAGNLLAETDPRGAVTEHDYDTLDRRVVTTLPEAEGAIFTESATYDLVGNRLSVTDRNGNTRTFAYDALDRLVTVTDPAPLGYVASFGYDAQGNRIVETGRRGIVSRSDYDAENRLLRLERDGLTLRTLTYDAAGNRISERDAEDRLTEFAYDRRNLLVATTHPALDETRVEVRDLMGDVIATRTGAPDGLTTVGEATYDLRRRMTAETNAVGETTTYEFDGNGNRIATVRPAGNRWERDYDGADRLVAVRDALLAETTYTYDGNGNLLSQTDAEARTTSFSYDALNRRLTRTYPDAAVEAATYDGNGNMLSRTDPLGRNTTYSYDALDRRTAASYPLPAPPTGDDLTSIATVYDPNGNATEITETYTGATGTRATLQSFDTFDRLTTVTDPKGETLGYGYHPAGTRATLTDPDGEVTRYTYDAKQRLVAVEVPGSGVTGYGYDANDDLERIDYPEGTRAAYSYDTAGRATAIEHTRGATFISRFDYTYDPNGNRASQRETRFDGTDETTTYGYDAADRLTAVAYPDETVTTTYDGVGNRLTETTVEAGGTPTGDRAYTYNSRHQLTAITDLFDPAASVAYTYDANGNQTSKTIAGETTTFTYDLRDRLIEISDDGGLVGRYRFDHQGLRIRKETPTTTQRYVYDDQSLLLETDDSGATLAKHNYGPRNLLSVEAGGELDYYFVDVLGSPFQISNADGSVDSYTQYDAWGNVRSRVSGDAPETFGFTGYQTDEETSLLYARARFYDPEIGRFLTQDPFEGTTSMPPSLHRYLYGYSNPTVWVDPTGEINVGIALREVFEAGEKVVSKLKDSINESDFAQDGLGKKISSDATKALSVAGGSLEMAAEAADQINNLVNIALLFQSEDGLQAVRELRQQAVSELRDELIEGARTVASSSQLAHEIREDPVQAGVQLAVFATQKATGSASFIQDLRNGDPDAVYETGKTLTKFATTLAVGSSASRAPHVAGTAAETATRAGRELVPIGRNSARKLLERRGLTRKQADDIVNSFRGQIYSRQGQAGEIFTVTEGSSGSASGVFVSRGSVGSTPQERVRRLALPPSNTGVVESQARLTRDQLLLEGEVAAQPAWGPDRAGGAWQVVTEGGKYTNAIERVPDP